MSYWLGRCFAVNRGLLKDKKWPFNDHRSGETVKNRRDSAPWAVPFGPVLRGLFCEIAPAHEAWRGARRAQPVCLAQLHKNHGGAQNVAPLAKIARSGARARGVPFRAAGQGWAGQGRVGQGKVGQAGAPALSGCLSWALAQDAF